jgi:hypothetical protein
MACVKPEPLHLVVYMHILPLRFPKPNKWLWRTLQGSYRRGYRASGLSADRLTPSQAGAKPVREAPHEASGMRLRPENGSNKAVRGLELWKSWIRGSVTVTTKRRSTDHRRPWRIGRLGTKAIEAARHKRNRVGAVAVLPSIHLHPCQGGPPPLNLSSRPERSAVEGPAVCLDGKTEPGGDSPTAHSLLPKVEPQVPPLRYAPVGMTNLRAAAHLGMGGGGWTEL